MPAFFQGISGALEDQESFHDAAVREVFEETALRIDRPVYSGFTHQYPIMEQWRKHYGAEPQQVEERVFTADISGMEDPVLSAEHTSFRWLRLSEALPLLTYGANAECLQRVDLLWSRAIGEAVPK